MWNYLSGNSSIKSSNISEIDSKEILGENKTQIRTKCRFAIRQHLNLNILTLTCIITTTDKGSFDEPFHGQTFEVTDEELTLIRAEVRNNG